VELPKTNIPSGYPTELEAVSNFNAAAFGVRVGPSVILGELPDGAVKEGNGRGLHAIRNFKRGEEICYLIGKFRTRVSEGEKLDLFHIVTNIPKSCTAVYLQVDPCCAGLYINDPNGHALTKSIQPNCEFLESGAPLDSPQKVVVVAMADIDGSPENPVEFWADYNCTDPTKGRRKDGVDDRKKRKVRKVRKPRVAGSKETVSRRAKKQKLTMAEDEGEIEDITSSKAMEVAEGQKAPSMVSSAPHLLS
jgi:hypothetical protein